MTIIIATSTSFLLNIHEVKKHMDININIYNIIIYILLAFFVYLVIKIFAANVFSNYLIINNFMVIGLTFFIFAYLGGFGEADS